MQKQNKLFMDYITRFDHAGVAVHMYKQRAFVLTNDTLYKIIDINKLTVNGEYYEARSVLADALAFIYGYYADNPHKDCISRDYNSWQQFFDTCFSDIGTWQEDKEVEFLFELQKKIERYKNVLMPYVTLDSEVYSTKTLIMQLAILTLLSTL